MPASRKELGDLWRAVNREMHERFRSAFRGSNLNFGALIPLRHIYKQPGVTVSELARQAGVVKSHVSKLVDQLVKEGYVEKRSDPADQRLLRVYVTPKGTAVMTEMEARATTAWSAIMDVLNEDELAEVERGLRTLTAALERSKPQANGDEDR